MACVKSLEELTTLQFLDSKIDPQFSLFANYRLKVFLPRVLYNLSNIERHDIKRFGDVYDNPIYFAPLSTSSANSRNEHIIWLSQENPEKLVVRQKATLFCRVPIGWCVP